MMRFSRFVVGLFVCSSLGASIASASAKAGKPQPPRLRLDDAARPVRYAARLAVQPTETTFRGSIDIDLVLARATDTLWLNGTHLRIQRAAFDVGGQKIAATPVAGGEDFVGFSTAKPLPAGPARLHVEYTGELSRRDDRGLFAQKENDRWYAISQFEAIYARRVFPCFDEPGFKTPWQLTIEAPKDDVVLSNTAPTSETDGRPGWKTVAFAPTRPLPSYLVAFAVGPFDIVDAGRAGKNHIPVRIVTPHGRGQDARYAREVTGTIVERLEGYFGTPFPFDKLDVVTIPLPTQFGAMENPGMVTFAQSLVVATPENDTILFKRSYAFTAAHEFAHQWFGDLVTTAWWDDIWLNESFASWMENKIVDAWHPEWQHHSGLVEARDGAMGSDSLTSARKIRQPIQSNDDIYNAFDGITYSKGEAVLGMFEHYVGADVFQRGIRHYLAAHADGNATADDFVAAIGKAAGQDLAPAWKSFLDQAGVPLLTVGLSCSGKPSLTVSQTRYLPIGSKGPATENWQLPFCVSWPAGGKVEHRCTMIGGNATTVPLPTAQCPDWVLANADAVGYYRVSYAGDLLSRLMSNQKSLSLPELLGVLDDVDALVGNGTMPLGDALALVPQLANDARREIVQHAVGLAAGIRDHLVPESLQPNYGRFVRKHFGERARQLAWLPRPGDDDDTRLLRPHVVSLVAEEGGDPPLRAQAVELTRKWLADRKAVDGDIVGWVLSAAARIGDRALFDQLHAAARTEKEREDRHRMVGTLGAFIDPALARRALEVALGDEFDPRESLSILWRETGWSSTRPLVWDFMQRNFAVLNRRLPLETMASLPWLAVSFCDQPHRVEMERFFRDRSPKLPGGPRALAQALEEIELCDAYVKAQQASAVKFLEKY
jgi:alanyl aminopeptidase